MLKGLRSLLVEGPEERVTEIPPMICIRATYAAHDGVIPEELTIDVPPQSVAPGDLTALIEYTIRCLCDVPARARSAYQRQEQLRS